MQLPNLRNNKTPDDIVVVGGGVAGLTAAMTGARLGYRTLLLEKAVLGGSVAVLESVVEYPGIEKIDGWELTQTMVRQAEDAGGKLIDSVEVIGVMERPDGCFGIETDTIGMLKARSVIVCTGGRSLMLELADEAHFAQQGIHTCVQCAGSRYKGKTVAIAGHNSWALRAAQHMLDLGCTVLHITGKTELSGNAALRDKLFKHERFRFLGGCHVTGLYGGDHLEEILVSGLDGGNYQRIRAAAVFVYRGIKPNSGIIPASKDMKGFLQVEENSMTSIPGVFGAGRVVHADPPIEVMAGDGSRAALAAAAWLHR